MDTEISLPFATDSQYPSEHSFFPDTEIPYRSDYTNSDWISMLGHMPYRIECVFDGIMEVMEITQDFCILLQDQSLLNTWSRI